MKISNWRLLFHGWRSNFEYEIICDDYDEDDDDGDDDDDIRLAIERKRGEKTDSIWLTIIARW